MSITRNGSPIWAVHPGEVLQEEFLKPMKLTSYALAKSIHVPAPRVNDIVLRKRGITPDTAVRFAKAFGTSEQFWLNLQSAYEVSKIKKEQRKEIESIEPIKKHAMAG
jgi:antitoxin HigA-1